jgi:hypothetical protein
MGDTLCVRCTRQLEEEDSLYRLTRTCERCFTTVLSSRGVVVSGYLESLRMPAALVARDQRILFSNGRFRKLAAGREVVGRTIGDALECIYSPLLGRCGEAVVCLLCRLKSSVENTWLTREGLRGVPFSFPHKEEGRRRFSITTEIVGDAVLLLMDPPGPWGAAGG